ncbi:MAG TPA: single-stranded-DNA-specific exonuclease RecJ [Solirubrobacterales bacterium]
MRVALDNSPARFELEPFSYADALTLVRELGVAEPVAVTLVRRGYRTVEEARAFLEAADRHDPFAFADMRAAVERVHAAIDRGERITVHGDYDADGVCSTAILVGALRELGADCDWFIPDRATEGYGLSLGTVETLAARGTRLLITVDCGVGSATEVARAAELGVDAIVTDHHQPGDQLPACPVLHPTVSGYPCADLCGAGVAHKLAEALLGRERAELDLDLVALATVADMVPLKGENRALVRAGLAEARRGRRPGLRALMAVAGVVPETLDEGDLAFRLGPRINAAGRLYRADAGVELLLTADELRAGQIAQELDRANLDRREQEAAVVADAERQLAALSPAMDEGAIVLWGRDWHPGVVGICASRLVERHRRPAILIALDGEGLGRGSGRAVPGFDLLAALHGCAPLLRKFGGHRAAAGLEVDAGRLEEFRERFRAVSAEALAAIDPTPVERVDAVVGGESLGLDVADQLAQLGPFGKGNPPVRLLVPSAEVRDVRPMGEGERHARFSLASGSARAAGVAFGVNGSLAKIAESGPIDLSVALELNHWNGAVEPRVVLGSIFVDDGEAQAPSKSVVPPSAAERARRFDAEWALGGQLPDPPAAPGGGEREVIERGRASGIATVAALASTGESVLVVVADALWRRALVERAARPARFGGGSVALVPARGSLEVGVAAARSLAGGGGVALADWGALALHPDLAARFRHVVVVDPAPSAELAALATAADEGGSGFLHVLAEARDASLTARALKLTYPDRDALVAAYRRLRERASGRALPAEEWWAALVDERAPWAVEFAARCLRVLHEIGVVQLGGEGEGRTLEVVSSVQAKLEESSSYAVYRDAREECLRYLSKGGKPS